MYRMNISQSLQQQKAKNEKVQSVRHPDSTCMSRNNKLHKMEKAAVTKFWTTGYILNLGTVVIVISYE